MKMDINICLEKKEVEWCSANITGFSLEIRASAPSFTSCEKVGKLFIVPPALWETKDMTPASQGYWVG